MSEKAVGISVSGSKKHLFHSPDFLEMTHLKDRNKKAGRRHFENFLVKSSLISWHLPSRRGEWGGRHFYRKLTLHEIKILEINAT